MKTLRELIRKSVEFCNLDEPINVRILTRNAHGSVVACRVVEISKWSEHTGFGACIDIEEEAIVHAKLQRG